MCVITEFVIYKGNIDILQSFHDTNFCKSVDG